LFIALLIIAQSLCQDLSSLKVQGNTIVNANGQKVWLRGVNRSGMEFMCIQGKGFYDGPVDDASISVIASWKANIVRIPLNEDCWLGINGVDSQYSGQNYINAVSQLVDRFRSHGFAVIVDLHWSAPGSTISDKQTPMPNKDHSIDFWVSVAKTFSDRLNVIFDLYNEPYPDNNQWNSTAGWTCLLSGGSCNGVSYPAAGMQSLVDAIRGTGSRNILMVGGIAYSNSLAMWLQYMPKDPLNNLAASWHSYDFNYCISQSCWEETIGHVAQTVPVIVGEFGTNKCSADYINQLLGWLDSAGQGQSMHYLAWTWNTWDCANGPALISNYDGTPTPYGQGYKSHLLG